MFSPQLSAGSIDISAQSSADCGGNTAILQDLLEPGYRSFGTGLQGTFLHMVQWNQIEMGRQTLEPTQQFLGMLRPVINTVYHSIFKRDPASGLFKIPMAGFK